MLYNITTYLHHAHKMIRVKPPYGGGSGVLVYILGPRDHGPKTVGPDPGLWAWDHWLGPWARGPRGPWARAWAQDRGPRGPWAPGPHGPQGRMGPGQWGRAWVGPVGPRPGHGPQTVCPAGPGSAPGPWAQAWAWTTEKARQYNENEACSAKRLFFLRILVVFEGRNAELR